MAQEQPKIVIDKRKIKLNLDTLGLYLDGWADLAEGMGSKADSARQEVIKSLRARDMPDIELEEISGGVSLSKEKRIYAIAETSPNVTTTIYIAKHGNDLYASWRTFWKPVINWKLLLMLGAIAAGLSLLGVIQEYISGINEAFRFLELSPTWSELRALASRAWFAWAINSVLFYLIARILFELLGPKEKSSRLDERHRIRKRKTSLNQLVVIAIGLGFIFSGYGSIIESIQFLWQTFSSSLARHNTSVEQFIRNTILIYIPGMIITAIAGWLHQYQPYYYFIVQPTVFDQEDIVALGLSAHNSILRSLDSAGIDVSKLRIKRDFNSGRRGEKI